MLSKHNLFYEEVDEVAGRASGMFVEG
jgi:hypothetical protein